MKSFLIALSICIPSTLTGVQAQDLFDDFNDGVVDSSKWSIVARAPSSSVTEAAGSAILTNRGTLVSLQSFPTYDITGRFRFTGSGPDRFIAWTRTSGVSTNEYFDLDDGIVFRFQQDISRVGIDVWRYPTNEIHAEATVDLPNDTWFDYRVTDDGTNVALYLTDLINPVITATTTFQSGNKIAFNNGEFSATTEMDFLTAVPERLSPVVGDYDANGVLDLQDLQLLVLGIREGTNFVFDLAPNQNLDHADLRVWVEDLKQTCLGDTDLDGQFNSSDLINVFQAGKFEDGRPRNATWSEGDWSGDLDFDSSDLVLAFQGGGYEQGPRVPTAAVPEPSTLANLLVGLIAVATVPRRGRNRFWLLTGVEKRIHVSRGTC